MKKTPNKISTEDLLAALEDAPESHNPVHEIFDFKNDVPKYLAKYEIEAGENSVSRRDLYRLYIQFSDFPVNSKAFNMSLTNFVQARSQKNVLINKTKVQIQELLHQKYKKNGRYTPAHVSTRKHFETFLEECKIKPGNKWVEHWVLLYIYHKWCRENRKSIRFKSKSFTSMVKLYLESKRTTNISCWFKIDESALLTLTEDDRRKIQDERTKTIENHRKKQKKEREVSRP